MTRHIRQKKIADEEMHESIFVKSIIAIALLFLLGVNLYSSFSNALNERKFEIGVRRAIGASPADIILQFFVEGLTVMLVNMMIEEPDKFGEQTSAYSKKYESIEKIPVLHAYNVSIEFDLQKQDFDTETISKMDIKVDGETYKIDGGNITLDADFTLGRGIKELNWILLYILKFHLI